MVEIDKLDLVLVETAGNEEAVLVTGYKPRLSVILGHHVPFNCFSKHSPSRGLVWQELNCSRKCGANDLLPAKQK